MTQREWGECIYNALFNTYHEESQSRKRYRAGDESDPEIQQKDHLLVRWKMRSDCFACQGFRQGQVRSKGQKRGPLGRVGAMQEGGRLIIGVACARFLFVTTELL